MLITLSRTKEGDYSNESSNITPNNFTSWSTPNCDHHSSSGDGISSSRSWPHDDGVSRPSRWTSTSRPFDPDAAPTAGAVLSQLPGIPCARHRTLSSTPSTVSADY